MQQILFRRNRKLTLCLIKHILMNQSPALRRIIKIKVNSVLNKRLFPVRDNHVRHIRRYNDRISPMQLIPHSRDNKFCAAGSNISIYMIDIPPFSG